jgi:hypothetical protein
MDIISKKTAKSLGLKKYFTGKPCPKSHISERSVATGQCCECERIRTAARRALDPEKHRQIVRKSNAKHYAKNKEKRNAATIKWHRENADYVREKRKEYYQQNAEMIKLQKRLERSKDREKHLERGRIYRAKNRDRINEQQDKRRKADPERYKAYREKWQVENPGYGSRRSRERRQSDPIYAFNCRVRCLIRGAIVRSGFVKSKQTEEILGCSIEQFRRQIERQFLPGMGWHNVSEWHIDHIIPVSTARTMEEAESLNTAGNLRPYWAGPNRSKSAKITHLL